MENNIDLVVLTSVVVILFIIFIIATIKELSKMSSEELAKKEGGPRADMIRYIGALFTDDSIEPGKKITFLNAVKAMIDDIPEEEDMNRKNKDQDASQ